MRAYDHPAVTAALFSPEPGATLEHTGSDRPIDVPLPGGGIAGAYWCGRRSEGPTLLVFGPGDRALSGSLDAWPRWAEDAGANLLLVDYPGIGSSPGAPSLGAAREAASAALRYLAGRPADEVPSIVLVGRGAVGAAVAAVAGSECASERIAALVLEGVVTDLAAYLAGRIAWDEVDLDRDALRRDLEGAFDVATAVARLEVPTLVLQPAFSSNAPPAAAECLAQRCGAEVVYFDGGERLAVSDCQPDEYRRQLVRWVEAYGRPPEDPDAG